MDIDQEEFDDLINKVNANKVWNGFLTKKIEFEHKMFMIFNYSWQVKSKLGACVDK